MLDPSEYDASYFDGDAQSLKHNAGYSRYERWYRNEGANSLGEYWKDKANGWVNHLVLANKKVLELACAKGFLVKDLRDLGVDAYGIDISPYAISQCEAGNEPYVSVGDARDLSAYANKEFDIIISFRLLECLSDVDVQLVLDQAKAKGKRQIHVVSVSPNPTYYQVRTPQEWIDDFPWPKGTVIAPYGDEFNYVTK